MIERIAAGFTQYLTPIVFAVGLTVGGGVAYVWQGGRVAKAQLELSAERLSNTAAREEAARVALENQAAAQQRLDDERARIEADIISAQARVASDTAKIRKQLNELSAQEGFACLRAPLPDSVLDGLRR